jgi:hypothetical protein
MKKKTMPEEYTRQILFDVDEDVHALLSALANANQISVDECAKGILLAWMMETEKSLQKDIDSWNKGVAEETDKSPLITLK